MSACLRIPSVDPEVVAVEARRHLESAVVAPVIPIGVRLTARPTPSLDGYDALLAGTGR
jgi:hypothetical protein